jgi:hypothetical protein
MQYDFFAKFLRNFHEESAVSVKTTKNIEKVVAKRYGNCEKRML